uniref:Uncharacterized protein n=1 Tax=Nelumbo nucifera TaxID=4432 RepID=A0A822ZLK1_NELNU|nr:TPA_asm: hypothetical protein HUJ06_002499 [Nelumbo nucifera]
MPDSSSPSPKMGFPQHHSSSDAVSQRVNSPRFSGPMTRRAHSFKRNNSNNNNPKTYHEIDLQLNSPRSENPGTPSPVLLDGLDSLSERKQALHQFQRLHLLKKPVGSIVVNFGLREKKKLGHWMFLLFCSLCLFLGVLKICATGWFGSAIERAGVYQDLSDISIANQVFQSFHEHEHMESGSDAERTLKMVASGVVNSENSVVEHLDIWSKPNSENFTQCINQPASQKSKQLKIMHKYIRICVRSFISTM